MVDRSLEVLSSLSSSAAMHSPHAGTIPARSGSTHRAGRSMHDIHRGTTVGACLMVDDATWFQSIQSTIAALARTSKALLIVLKPYVQRVA